MKDNVLKQITVETCQCDLSKKLKKVFREVIGEYKKINLVTQLVCVYS